MSGYLLDASALLALLQRERGADAVASLLPAAAISSVNWSEVVQKANAHAVDTAGLADDLTALGVEIIGFGTGDAEAAARLWLDGARQLSLADRACLATAQRRRSAVVTADRSWTKLDLRVEIRSIR